MQRHALGHSHTFYTHVHINTSTDTTMYAFPSQTHMIPSKNTHTDIHTIPNTGTHRHTHKCTHLLSAHFYSLQIEAILSWLDLNWAKAVVLLMHCTKTSPSLPL